MLEEEQVGAIGMRLCYEKRTSNDAEHPGGLSGHADGRRSCAEADHPSLGKQTFTVLRHLDGEPGDHLTSSSPLQNTARL